jgi:hypothetical protein
MGHENVASNVSWALHLLAAYPEKQEVLFTELSTLHKSSAAGERFSIETLQRCKYLDCVLKESQRLFPPVPMLSRQNLCDVSIAGYSIPKGVSFNNACNNTPAAVNGFTYELMVTDVCRQVCMSVGRGHTARSYLGRSG